MDLVGHHIAGRSRTEVPERVGEIYDPSTGEVARRVAFATTEVVSEAVAAATDAATRWGATPLGARTAKMFAFRQLLDERRRDLALAIAEEHGKVVDDALGEVARGVEVVEFACGISHLLKGEYSEGVATGLDTYSIRQPLGVVAGITPFNFPAMVPLWMFPLAVACGNAFVLKPSEKAPSAAMMLAEWMLEAGVPAGVLNVVHGDKVAVDALLSHPDVAAVSSVGSTPVARYIYETASRNGKRVQALGGAKNHMVVMPDADIDAAADALVGAAYGSTGQRCMAISAVVAVGDAGDLLRDAIAERIGRLKIGPSTDPDAEMGPLVTAAARDKVLSYVETGVNEGADLAVDGRAANVEGFEGGFFVGPCLFDHVSPTMTIYRDEIFGPVLCMLRVDSLEDAIALVNESEYGNGTAVFTRSGGAAQRFQRDILAGMVGINVPLPVPVAFYPFGGWKNSLFGGHHIYGEDGVAFYTRRKVVTARWPKDDAGVRLNFPS